MIPKIVLDNEKFQKNIFVKIITNAGLYVMALAFVILNGLHIFDNVLWGDEAYTAIAVRHNLHDMFEIIYYTDSHPPLYYLWVKLLHTLFGESSVLYHMASFTFYIVLVVLIITLGKKYFGKLASAFLLILVSLSASCTEYCVEIRMYELAFLAVFVGMFFCYRLFKGSKHAWIGMVICATIAAYSHYYALVISGLLLFSTTIMAQIRFKGKTWIKGVLSMVVFGILYAPWLMVLFKQISDMTSDFWIESILPIGDYTSFLLGGDNMKKLVLIVLAMSLLIIFVYETAMVEYRKNTNELFITAPEIKKWMWSDDFFAIFTGLLAVCLMVIFVYGYSVVMQPIVVQRYAYPASAIVMFVTALSLSKVIKLAKNSGYQWIYNVSIVLVFVILIIGTASGYTGYKNYDNTAKVEKINTEEVLGMIGNISSDTVLVSNGVKHLGYTVLKYYYPDNEIINDVCTNVEADKMWFFSCDFLSEEDINLMYEKGYTVYGYGQKQMVKYPLVLYYFER